MENEKWPRAAIAPVSFPRSPLAQVQNNACIFNKHTNIFKFQAMTESIDDLFGCFEDKAGEECVSKEDEGSSTKQSSNRYVKFNLTSKCGILRFFCDRNSDGGVKGAKREGESDDGAQIAAKRHKIEEEIVDLEDIK